MDFWADDFSALAIAGIADVDSSSRPLKIHQLLPKARFTLKVL